jgi:mannose-1-phosphate guanylyltransferase/mannose-6-phosphate isomerase
MAIRIQPVIMARDSGRVRRLANPANVPLEIIETQSGSYLGEDDIVRFEDTYGRK